MVKAQNKGNQSVKQNPDYKRRCRYMQKVPM